LEDWALTRLASAAADIGSISRSTLMRREHPPGDSRYPEDARGSRRWRLAQVGTCFGSMSGQIGVAADMGEHIPPASVILVPCAQFAHTPQAIRGYERARQPGGNRVTMRLPYPLIPSRYRLVLLAMQKVEGSSPFSRFFPLNEAF
jgi:hypothetical protein